MSKCDNCAVMAKMNECEEACACAWYIDNVIFGEKSVDDCTAFKKVDNKENKNGN